MTRVANKISESYRRPSNPAVDICYKIKLQIQSKPEKQKFQKMSSRRQVLQKVRIPDYDHDNTDSIKSEFITHFWVLPLRPHLIV